MPSLITITPDVSSTTTQGISARLPLASYAPIQRTWQRQRRDVIQVLTDSLLERRRLPSTYGSTR